MPVTYDNFGEFVAVSERISGGMTDWLKAEQRSSSVPGSTNSYLDNLELIQYGLTLPYDDPNNWSAQKNQSQLGNRLLNYWRAFETEPGNDTLSAMLTFTPMMLVSGYFRTQCAIQARSPEEYRDRRLGQGNVVGFDLRVQVASQLARRLVSMNDLSDAAITLEELEAQKDLTRDVASNSYHTVIDRTNHGLDFGQEESESVDQLLRGQTFLVNLATDCVVFAAKIRDGDLAKVPLLEPKSISEDPQVIYPFAQIA